MTGRAETGHRAETLAQRYLEKHGLRTIDRNFRSRFGEIDLIMREGETLVFVEVRYRRNTAFGGPLASVDARKQKRLRAAAQAYLQRHDRYARDPMRFDVIGVMGENARIDWLKNAFDDSAG